MYATFATPSISYNKSTGALTRSGNCNATIQFVYSPQQPILSLAASSISIFAFYIE